VLRPGRRVSFSLFVYLADKGVIDVIDRREEGRNTRGRGWTYDQGAHEILDTVAAEVEVWICVGELSQR
jgi:hypothetical protein